MFLTLVVSAATLMSMRSRQDTGELVQRAERGSAGRGDAGWESGGGAGSGDGYRTCDTTTCPLLTLSLGGS
jgi:hypothetical protein